MADQSSDKYWRVKLLHEAACRHDRDKSVVMESWEEMDEATKETLRLALDELFPIPSAGGDCITVPRNIFRGDADHLGRPIWDLDVKLVGETLDQAVGRLAPSPERFNVAVPGAGKPGEVAERGEPIAAPSGEGETPSSDTPSSEGERMIPHRVAPVCEEHDDKGGSRSGCPYCALTKLQFALGRIDYLCGKPNDMEVSDYDVYYNEDAVVENVKRALVPVSATGEREKAAGDILLALVTAKLYKDTRGADAAYEIKKNEAWALAKAYLQYAMPDEYLTVLNAMGGAMDSSNAQEPK